MSNYKYVYKENDVVNNLKIIEQIRLPQGKVKSMVKGYKYKCLKCNYVGTIKEVKLNQGRGCCVCHNQKIIKGINDITTTNPSLIKYFKNIKDAESHSLGSNKKAIAKCPNCGLEKEIVIYNIINFSCPNCSDGFSYSEKFLMELFTELNVDFVLGKTFDWSNHKIYDFYILSISLICEAHGIQHYKDSLNWNSSYIKQKENDDYKEKLAKENDIKYYIQLDCRKSELEWIKNSILNSELNELFDLSNVDWNKCEINSFKSKMIESINLWNDGLSIKEITKIIKLNRATIRNYLKRGSSQNLCNYNSETNKYCVIQHNKAINSKKVKCIETNCTYNSYTECALEMSKIYNIRFHSSHIGKVCNGTRKTHKGFHFTNINKNKTLDIQLERLIEEE